MSDTIKVILKDGNNHEVPTEVMVYEVLVNNIVNRITVLWIITLIVWWFK